MDYHWNIDFGMALRRLRKERNLSQEELAERSVLDRSYISLLERNLELPGFITILTPASGLGMRASEFMIEIEQHPVLLPIHA
ncbi:helix-turn-helix transcriptional regulator [Paenibacillus sp. BSR1-1]|uniref:helix-turn-helix domain-containing protein n=1 Tax=Paenibacillus sp. BSR1-1 TaxID=3020845 RepID=UPI0025B048CE|nr:helix-turn-helix transcriptional regulator [Paenibacillus sp. BSR1-1]MDN3019214.1 helix-turn-helix transcriptional regulator [Paenibacillus sp. BSR1-1]